MANGHGGARPGAGRKKKSTLRQQEANRERLLRSVTPQDIADMAGALIAFARAGNPRAFMALAPYLFGASIQQHEIHGAEGGPIVFSLHVGDAEPTPDLELPAPAPHALPDGRAVLP